MFTSLAKATRWASVTATAGVFLALLVPVRSEAASGADFNPGMIISDAVFYDGNAMGVGDIQAFLNSRVSSCLGSNGQSCLKDYRMATPATPQLPNRCWDMGATSNSSAAEIIFRVAQACSINPKVLIVLLEKEQGLVSSRAPTSRMYRSATGYGCPDTADCDAEYYGFFNQVFSAARQFRSYQLNPSSYRYQAGRSNSILWNPNAACGTSNVYIDNQATAGLYNYTPYRPNDAALSNLYGTGDSCSTYGNRNFWRLFTDWFGQVYAESEATAGIQALWQQLGGDAGKLGPATGGLVCKPSGCSRSFANGIAYSPVGGTFAVTGGHAARYVQLGETGGVLGFPRSNEIATPSGGSYISFQNGLLMWSLPSGIRAVTGGHADFYRSLGGSEGFLAYPLSDELQATGGGTYISYQGGITIWSSESGLHALDINHANTYRAQGGSSSKVGYPVSDVQSAGAGATWVRYQYGLSLWSSSTGAFVIPTGHAVAYERSGGSGGVLGLPLSTETPVPSGGSYVKYQNGYTIWSPSTGTQVLSGVQASAYASVGGTQSKLGYPIGGVESLPGGGTVVRYQNGSTYSSPATGAHAVPGGHAATYLANGGPSGSLGFPTSSEISQGNGTYVTYEHGKTVWFPGSPVRTLDENNARAFDRAGGLEGKLGLPKTAVQATGNGGTFVEYASGYTLWSPSTGDHSVPTGHAVRYGELGGSQGPLGFPTSDETSGPLGGTMVSFQNGSLYWSPRTRVAEVIGGFRDAFLGSGGPSGILGYPTAPAMSTASGSTLTFEHGAIEWDRGSGTYTVVGF